MKVSSSVDKRERKAIGKLKHSNSYKWVLALFVFTLSPVKKFISLPLKAASKACWVISLSVYNILGIKIWYIDDFIVHKKLRGKWYGKQLFDSTNDQAIKEKCDYVFLVSRKDRKASHRFYKKAGLTIIGLWVGIVAYKKFTHKK